MIACKVQCYACANSATAKQCTSSKNMLIYLCTPFFRLLTFILQFLVLRYLFLQVAALFYLTSPRLSLAKHSVLDQYIINGRGITSKYQAKLLQICAVQV